MSRYVRRHVQGEFADRFGGQVALADLKISIFPEIVVSGRGVVVRRNDAMEDPPLVALRGFRLRTGLLELLRSQKHVNSLELEGLRITIPHRRGKRPHGQAGGQARRIVIDELTAEDATLVLLRKEPQKPPLRFDLHRLAMQSVGLEQPAAFQARLRNPRPPGEIHVRGQFGPWDTDDPGETPLSATYTFTHADLGAFKGISGMLSSNGRFAGVLQHIKVDGETDTPDFAVRTSGHPVALHTRFHAIVDGLNGNTELQPVHASFLNSAVFARGAVFKEPAEEGRTVALDIDIENARVEDLLLLATKSAQPAMTGATSLHLKFLLPPGHGDVLDRLQLDGVFGIAAARFTKLGVEEKLKSLSRHGEGEPKNPEAGSAVSDLRGHLVLRNGVVSFTDLAFSVPGASVELAGAYRLASEELDFHGTLRLAAPVSKATTGVKSFFLKLVEPFVKGKYSGTELPIHIAGTREHPSFGLGK